MINRKRIREIIGYTQARQIANPDAWHALAKSFHLATKVLHECQERMPSDSRPFALNAALSIELILKSILAKKGAAIPDGNDGHDLRTLCTKAGVGLTTTQMTTLELLTEIIVWAGRYPAAKTEKRWDVYQDSIFEKHIARSREGNVFRSIANTDTFPSWENYEKIWNCCMGESKHLPSARRSVSNP